MNASKVIAGIDEVYSGGKDVAIFLARVVRRIPGFIRRNASCLAPLRFIRKRASGLKFCTGKAVALTPSFGTGYCGLRMILNRQILTRAYGGRLQVYDGFGSRKSRMPQNFCGTRLISTQVELAQSLADFRAGSLNQWLNVDIRRTSLEEARAMWRTLCNEELTGLVLQDCPLSAMALQAGALLEEKKALEAQLLNAEGIVDELNSCVAALDDKLTGYEVTPKLEHE